MGTMSTKSYKGIAVRMDGVIRTVVPLQKRMFNIRPS